MRPCLGNARGGPGPQRVFRKGQFCLLPGCCYCCFLNFKEVRWASDLYLLVLEFIKKTLGPTSAIVEISSYAKLIY